MNNLGRSLLFALFGVVFILPIASAGLVGVYLNDSEDLVTSEEDITLPYGKDFILTFHVGGPYRIESGDDNFSAYSINVDVHFLSDVDRRDSCTMCAIPNLKPLGDTDKDPGYDTYQATFFSDMVAFEEYSGNIQFSIIIKNRTSGIVWDDVFEVTIGPASSGDSGSSFAFSIPELPPVIQDNLMEIGIGLLVVIILSVVIYTFILAPEDMTADLYKVKESIDPLSKSLTGVGYDSDLPGKEDEDDDTEDLLDDDEEELDDDEEEFDESKLLAELTGTGSQKLKSTDDEEKEEPEPPKAAKPKKAVKKKVVKRSVSKKVVRKAAPPQDAPKRSPVNMGEGIISITCPSCEKVHNVDEDTVKFICGCGRRIRMN